MLSSGSNELPERYIMLCFASVSNEQKKKNMDQALKTKKLC